MAVATDYDGTLAKDGVVEQRELGTLRRLKKSGRRLILVTGRELPDLKSVFPDHAVFDLIVAENGALLYRTGTGEEEPLCPPPPEPFVARLRELGVNPLSIGRSIVATWEPNEALVLQAVRELGLELHIVFNKGAVMVLPGNVNKATGLAAALRALDLSPHNVVGIGDAENDHAFLTFCGCAVAVANALPSVKAAADLVTERARGAGLTEAADRLLANDLNDVSASFSRFQIPVGEGDDGEQVCLSPHDGSALVAGTSGGGKSTIVAGILERMNERAFQFCVVDPEGDYSEFEGAVVLGDAKQAPRIEEVLELLARPEISVVVNLLALSMPDRPRFFAELLPRLCRLRAETGRPHWIVIDEAHHMLPAGQQTVPLTLPKDLPAIVLVTVHPDQISTDALGAIGNVFAIGRTPAIVLDQFCTGVGVLPPPTSAADLPAGVALFWKRGQTSARPIAIMGPKLGLQRHVRKYAEGELGTDKSFYFRGPQGALNLRAQNLSIFLQIADGVDDGTWLHHLRTGDYSRWFRESIKDAELAAEAARIEVDESLDGRGSRELIRKLIADRYTGPADESGR